MNEPVTDEEKIEWLWNRLDKTESEVSFLEAQNTILTNNNEKLLSTVSQLSKEIAIMGVELNAAREAARESVINYIASMEK